MLKYNNIIYVKKGTAEDNGQYDHYYYTKYITNTYNIIYEGQRGTLKTSTNYFFDLDTDRIITRDYYTWSLKYGIISRSGTCFNSNDEAWINDIIENNTYEPDTARPDSSIIIDDNNPFGNNSYTGDDPNGLNGNNNNKDDNTGNNLFDNTFGNNNDTKPGRLPIGSDINNVDRLSDYSELDESQNPNIETAISNKGTDFPIIRINDHYFLQEEIMKFSMETGYYKDYTEYKRVGYPLSGFLPTMRLIVRLQNPDLLKTEHIKQGDRCSVFFTSTNKMIKSMRCDFRITSAVTEDMDQNRFRLYTTYIILGELYIPDLYNENLRYNFNGTSRDSMIDAAKKLRLSFFFCDPENTTAPQEGMEGGDTMVWCCNKTIKDFILDNTAHAWKDTNSFYESFIDPRYGLAFLNINYLLGSSGLDDNIDLTFFIKSYTHQLDTLTEDQNEPKDIQGYGKLLSNIQNDKDAVTIFHVNSWKYINKAQEIQDFIGLNCRMHLEPVNSIFMKEGIKDNVNNKTNDNISKTGYSIDYTMCYNPDKWNPNPKHGEVNEFYVLTGPGRNLTYSEGYEDSNEQIDSFKQTLLKITNMMSDGDQESIAVTGTNELASGNTHKFYDIAYEHNMRNLLQLQKLIIQVELNGVNLAITRGEKIPMLLTDIDNTVNMLYRSKQYADEKEKSLLANTTKDTIEKNLSKYITELYKQEQYQKNTPKWSQQQQNITNIAQGGVDIINNKNNALNPNNIDKTDQSSLREHSQTNDKENGKQNAATFTQLNDLIYEAESGWYIIDGIEWVYDGTQPSGTGTNWHTNVKLTRREWPIPNTRTNKNQVDQEHVLILNNPGALGSIRLAAKDLINYGYTVEDVQDIETDYYIKGKRVYKRVGDDGVVTYEDADGNIYDENGNLERNIDIEEVLVTAQKPGQKQKNENEDKNIVTSSASTPGEIENITGATLLETNGNIAGKDIISTGGGVTMIPGISGISLSQDKVDNSDITLTGLTEYMKQIYRSIETASDKKIKLVSARRYAVDKDGMRIAGNACVMNGGYYKCLSSTGDVLYFKNNNSRHLYGEAIDIINSNGIGFVDLMTQVIMVNGDILKQFYENGVSAYIEQSVDDTGTTTKHYHIGTDTIKQREFWASVKAILGTDVIPGTRLTFSNYTKHNKQQDEIDNDVFYE